MSVSFDTIKAGDKLYDVRRERGRLCWWLIYVKKVDREKRRALVSWNGNPATWKGESYFKRGNVRRSRPK